MYFLTSSSYSVSIRFITPSQRGTYIAHREVWQAFIDEDKVPEADSQSRDAVGTPPNPHPSGLLVVLEDDLEVHVNSTILTQAIQDGLEQMKQQDADWLYLGWCESPVQQVRFEVSAVPAAVLMREYE